MTVNSTQAARAEELADRNEQTIQERIKLTEKYAKYGLTRSTQAARAKQDKEAVIKAAEEALGENQKVVAGKE